MIDMERAVLRKIKRANTDWWINEKAIVAANGKTYIAYYTDMGEIHVKEIDAKCSRALSRDVRLCTLNQNYADEHNAPALLNYKEPEPRKQDIANALKAGFLFDHAHLEQKNNIQSK